MASYHNFEQERLECEARHMKQWARKHGRQAWEQRKRRIKEKRGQKGLDRLLAEMNKNCK